MFFALRSATRAAVAALVGALALDAHQQACAADAFPYIAYVTRPETFIRSGPGGNYYPTEKLSVGYAVEVYRHDGDGWCTIRPVAESFCLAPAHQLRVLDSRTAEVLAPRVPARIGTNLGDQRSAVQVLLDRGELVQLIEEPVPGRSWIKIAPPAGEFRWISARSLRRTPPTEGAPSGQWQSTTDAAGEVVPAQHNEDLLASNDPFAHLDAALADPAAPTPSASGNSSWRPNAVGAAAPPTAAELTAGSDQMEVIPGSPAAEQAAAPPMAPGLIADSFAGAADGLAAETKPGQPRIRFEGLSAPTGPFDPRVAEMQLRLSQAVVEPPATWRLGGLREETAMLLAQGKTPELRDQLRDLLDRIAVFENIQTRYRQVGATTGGNALATRQPFARQLSGAAVATGPATETGMTGQSGEVLARVRSDLGVDDGVAPTPGGVSSVAAAPATEALYDAVGTLKPVVSRRSQAPRFALVDDHGDVVTFVTASPDVNLQSYVGQRIGVRGNRGFMPEYRRAHVTATRVTPLEEKLVR